MVSPDLVYPAPSKYIAPSDMTNFGILSTVNDALFPSTAPVGVSIFTPDDPVAPLTTHAISPDVSCSPLTLMCDILES